jgi:hypothetical protein
MAVVVVAAAALFLVGVMIGIIAVVALAVRREDRHNSLIGEAPAVLARSARLLNGLGRRDQDAELFRPGGELDP